MIYWREQDSNVRQFSVSIFQNIITYQDLSPCLGKVFPEKRNGKEFCLKRSDLQAKHVCDNSAVLFIQWRIEGRCLKLANKGMEIRYRAWWKRNKIP